MKLEFEVGQIIEAKVITSVDQSHFIVDIEGNFLRVENQSLLKIHVGDLIKLVVDSHTPLRMKLHKHSIAGHVHFHV